MIETWTADRVNRLKKYSSEGKSASEIATIFGGFFTRNAILGKMYRLGLSSPFINRWTPDREAILRELWAQARSEHHIARVLGVTQPTISIKLYRLGLKSGPTRIKKKRTPEEQKFARKKALILRAFGDKAYQKIEVEMVVEPPMEEPTPESAVTLRDIGPDQCRYPLGDPAGFETLFCGAASLDEQSYCGFHYKRTHSFTRTEQSKATIRTSIRTSVRFLGGHA